MRFLNHQYYSILYCCSFFQLSLISASIGPLIPIKAKQIGIAETDFAFVFIVGGIGGLIGSLTCKKLEKYLNWHNILALGYFLMSLTAFILSTTKTLYLFAFAQLLLNYSLIVVNSITTVALFQIQKQNTEMWLKILHMSFSIFAFITPIILSIFMAKAQIYYGIYGLILTGLYLYIQFPDNHSETNDKLINNDNIQNTQQIIPNSMHILMLIFFFVYMSDQGSYAGWISTYGAMSENITLNQAIYAPGIFWLFLTIGRFLSIFMTLIWNLQQQINILITGLLISAILGVIFALSGLDLLVLYLISAGYGIFMSAMYPSILLLPKSFGFILKTQHTANYGLAACIAMLTIYYLTGLGMSYFGRYYFVFSELVCTLSSYVIVKLIINFGNQHKKNRKYINENVKQMVKL